MTQIDSNNKERQKLELVMRDIKSGLHEVVKYRTDTQRITETLNKQSEVSNQIFPHWLI
jgi:hypothetical protein